MVDEMAAQLVVEWVDERAARWAAERAGPRAVLKADQLAAQ